MRRNFLIGLALLLLVSLAIGIFWTMRLDIPMNPKPWWYGKETVVRMEAWEPGKDMPTFAMTVPKKTLDAMYAMGVKQAIDVEGRRIELSQIWRELQRLPKGQKITMHEDNATLHIWIEEKGARRESRADTTATSY
jgi:hypothetical protein